MDRSEPQRKTVLNKAGRISGIINSEMAELVKAEPLSITYASYASNLSPENGMR